jgi:hypothetical protein
MIILNATRGVVIFGAVASLTGLIRGSARDDIGDTAIWAFFLGVVLMAIGGVAFALESFI